MGRATWKGTVAGSLVEGKGEGEGGERELMIERIGSIVMLGRIVFIKRRMKRMGVIMRVITIMMITKRTRGRSGSSRGKYKRSTRSQWLIKYTPSPDSKSPPSSISSAAAVQANHNKPKP